MIKASGRECLRIKSVAEGQVIAPGHDKSMQKGLSQDKICGRRAGYNPRDMIKASRRGYIQQKSVAKGQIIASGI